MKCKSSAQLLSGAILWVALQCVAVASADTARALWVAQETRFVYRSQLTLYECASIREKVADILDALGARQATVHLQSCSIAPASIGTPSQLVSMQIQVVHAAPATAELRAALAKQQSRCELLERLGARTLAPEEFVAVWRDVDLVAERSLRLTSADCELLTQLREQVLPKLAVKVVASNRTCSQTPHRLRKPTFKVLALMQPPHADEMSAVQRAP